MAYYFRVFCTSDTVPPLPEVLNWVKERGVNLMIDPEDAGMQAASKDWGVVPINLSYQDGKQPFLVEVNRREGDDSLAAQEINEFLEELQQRTDKPRKRNQVIAHLRDTRYIVACRIPVEDIDDAGFHAIDVFLAYFVVHHGGMVQADGQGFYEMGKLVVDIAA